MAYSKRTWKARQGVGLNKFIIGVADGEGKQTITNYPDSITESGDALSATNLNDFEERIEDAFEEESTARSNADTTLQGNIDAEETARENADTTLQGNINTLSGNVTSHTSNTSNPHSVTKAQVGLGNVDNTSDLNKPISTATQSALDLKQDKDADAVEGNVAKFDANGNTIDSGIESDNVAQQDGYYQDMTVGDSEQLVSTVRVEDDVPYTFRTSGGSADIGNRAYVEKIVGVSRGWNQLLSSNNFTNSSTDTMSMLRLYIRLAQSPWTVLYTEDISSPKYLRVIVTANFSGTVHILHSGSNTNIYIGSTFNVVDGHKYLISMNILGANPSVVGGLILNDMNITDLTLLFGAGNEPSTVEDAIAQIPQLAQYNAYNAGELISTKLRKKKVIGFNAYNPTTGTAILLGGNQYQLTGTYTSFSYSTGETITLDSEGQFTPSANGTLTIVGGNSTDTCVHLVWSGYRNGEWEAYEEHEYDFDQELELRGIAKYDANGNLYYDGDEYYPDGTVTRNCGVRAYQEGDENNSEVATDGTNTVYKLDSPTTETADPYVEIQQVNDFGTEEFICDGDVVFSVGHYTEYPANLRDKLQHLPSPASESGRYAIQQTGNDMELVEDNSPTRLSMLEYDVDDLRSIHFTDDEISYPNNVYGTGTVPTVDRDKVQVKTLKGVTRGWNQLAKELTSSNWKVSTGSMTDGVYTGTSVSGAYLFYSQTNLVVANHTYLYFLKYSSTNPLTIWLNSSTYALPASSSKTVSSIILTAPSSLTSIRPDIGFNLSASDVGTIITVEDLCLYDLTLLFGSGNEPSTVAEALARIPQLGQYNDFDEGNLVSTTYSAVQSKSRNVWDEQWELGYLSTSDGSEISSTTGIRSDDYISVLPSTSYDFGSSIKSYASPSLSIAVVFYDADKEFISHSSIYSNWSTSAFVKTTPSDCFYVRFFMSSSYGTTYNNDICINLSDSQNGTYTPYFTSTLPLPSPWTGRSAGSVADTLELNVEVDGVNYRRETKRVSDLILLTSLAWTKATKEHGYYSEVLTNIKIPSYYAVANALISAGYELVAEGVYSNSDGFVFCITSSGRLNINDPTASDLTDFTTNKISGKSFQYALSTPVVTLSDPVIDNFIPTEAYGTLTPTQTQEPKIDTAFTIYAPHEVEFVKVSDVEDSLTSTSTIKPLSAKQGKTLKDTIDGMVSVPTPPTTDGTYRLTATVSSGVATLSWEAE